MTAARSLHFDGRALLFQLGLHLRGLVLSDAGLHGLWGAVDQVLGFLQAEARELTDDLDDLNLLRAGFLEDDVELRLLLDRGRRGSAATAGGGAANRSRRNGHVELALECVDQ